VVENPTPTIRGGRSDNNSNEIAATIILVLLKIEFIWDIGNLFKSLEHFLQVKITNF
jgi:hypothetical protein